MVDMELAKKMLRNENCLNDAIYNVWQTNDLKRSRGK